MLIFNDIWEFGFDMDILHQFDQWLWLLVRLWWGPCLSSRHTLNIDFVLCCVWILLCTSWMCHASLPGCLCLSSFSLSSCLSVSHLSSITSFNHQQSRSDGKILSICLRGFENVFLFLSGKTSGLGETVTPSPSFCLSIWHALEVYKMLYNLNPYTVKAGL